MILKGLKLGPTCFTILMTHLYYHLIYAKYFRNNFEKAVNIYPFINSKYKNEILSGAKRIQTFYASPIKAFYQCVK